MDQLLKINITHSRISMHTRQGQFVKTGKDGSSQAIQEINKQSGGGIQIDSQPARLELNTDEVLDSVSPRKWTSITSDFRDKGKEAAMEATAEYEQDGENYMDPDVNGVTQSSKAYVLEEANQWWGMGWTPSVQAHGEYIPGSLDISYTPDEISVDVQKGQSPFKYQAGGTEVNFEQRGGVDVEYVGGYRRFPTGKHIDTKA